MHFATMDTRKLNVFVVGLERFNLRLLRSVRELRAFMRFFGLLSHAGDLCRRRVFDLEALLDKARAILRGFDGSRSTPSWWYWDFPRPS